MMTYKGKFLQAPHELQELSSVSRRTVFLLTKKEGVRGSALNLLMGNYVQKPV